MRLSYNNREKQFSLHEIDYEKLLMIVNGFDKKIKEISNMNTELKLFMLEITNPKVKKETKSQIAYLEGINISLKKDVANINNILEWMIDTTPSKNIEGD